MSLAMIFFKTFLRLLLILPSTVAVAAEDENKKMNLNNFFHMSYVFVFNCKQQRERCGNPVCIYMLNVLQGDGILVQGGGVLMKVQINISIWATAHLPLP